MTKLDVHSNVLSFASSLDPLNFDESIKVQARLMFESDFLSTQS